MKIQKGSFCTARKSDIEIILIRVRESRSNKLAADDYWTL